jgi:hypothetical protein
VETKKTLRISANPLLTRQVVSLTLAMLLPYRQHWTPQRDGFAATVAADLPDGTPWQQTIRLISRPCRFGGWRHFLVCHRCGGGGLALYWSADSFFVCRGCAGLRYFSKTWNAASRLWRLYDELASDLRHRPGVKPVRYFRYDFLAIANFARHLSSMTRQIEAREGKAKIAVRARRA